MIWRLAFGKCSLKCVYHVSTKSFSIYEKISNLVLLKKNKMANCLNVVRSIHGNGTIGIVSRQVNRRLILSACSRKLSKAQVSTALRPFYFLVHPGEIQRFVVSHRAQFLMCPVSFSDLFAKYPIERAVNETSFKLLTSYLNMMIEERKLPRPVDVTFYLKPRTGNSQPHGKKHLRI